MKVVQVDEKGAGQEYNHCWTKFRWTALYKRMTRTDPYPIHKFMTKDPLPHYRWADAVVSVKLVQTQEKEIANEYFEVRMQNFQMLKQA